MLNRANLAICLAALSLAVSAAALLHGRTAPVSFQGGVTPEAVEAALLSRPEMVLEAAQRLQDRRDDQERTLSLSAVNANADALFQVPADHVLGNPMGHRVVAEFFDYQCPHCRESENAINAALGADPELKLVLHDLPVINQASIVAAKAAAYATRQGRYLAMRDALMRQPMPFDMDRIDAAAVAAGLDPGEMHAYVASAEATRSVKSEMDLAARLGISGTPAFLAQGAGVLKGFGSAARFAAFTALIRQP